ncbi:mannan endo-1 4-beta-mannosidase [Striga asiatica]|uniref:mannan endo-1,4-beta-mannosidase n=1 Tax=Striga asiatica TaxID=4170 RepID=A0A5A7PZ88_STRAF|nr:mannan endo-1 4-beta-mannosidase [Striga asiatica]
MAKYSFKLRVGLLLCLLFLVFEPRMSLAAYSGYVETKGTQFVLNDSPFIFNGFNAYWMMHVASQPNQREKVSNVFREAANAGLTVCRTWAFSDGGDEALQISPGVYNEYVFQSKASAQVPISRREQGRKKTKAYIESKRKSLLKGAIKIQASVERVFSAMNLVKNPLRNRMGDQWMDDSLLVYIEKDVFNSISNDAIMHRFQNMKSRRGHIYFFILPWLGKNSVSAAAAKYKIRLILSLSNNYQDFGGRAQYVRWAKNAGAQTKSDDDFYTNELVKEYYKRHVQRVLNRINTITGAAYKDDPIIMAWELINEPRCQADYSGDTVNAWVQEMASHVKSIDSKHLLEVGMEGFYGDSFPDRKQYNPGYQVGTDFITTNLIEEIDFTTIHAYPDAWLSSQDDDTQMVFMRRWMTSHWRDSKTLLRKPMVFTEFGKSCKDKGFSIASRDSYMNAVYSSLYSFARGGGIGGGLVWQILDVGMESYADGYEIVLSDSPSTSSIISQQSRQMTALQHMMSKP